MIKINCICDPMGCPNREFDWKASVDGQEELYGVCEGRTYSEAVQRLQWRIEDVTPGALGIPRDDCPKCGRSLMPSGKCAAKCLD